MKSKKKSSGQKSTAKKKTQKKKTGASSSIAKSFKKGLDSAVANVEKLFALAPSTLVAAIKVDHEALRHFIKVLKDTDTEMTERRRAYELFSDLLKSHSRAEEKMVYQTAREFPGREMHMKVTEGFVEHHVGDDLMAKIEKLEDPMEWSAHVNVLAEVVEHHLDEEESDLLPELKKHIPEKIRSEKLSYFLDFRQKTQKHVTAESAGVLNTSD